MTVCNMSIEAGAKAGLIAPDDTTFEYLAGRAHAPTRATTWDAAVADWRTLSADDGAAWDKEVVHRRRRRSRPQVTLGHQPRPGHRRSTASCRRPTDFADPTTQRDASPAHSSTWASTAGTPIRDIAVDTVFIGSCTNSRIEDLRAAAAVMRRPHGHGQAGDGRARQPRRARPRPRPRACDQIFTAAGADWREPGCSMCLAMNPDKLAPGERAASTSNRNFEGRQGRGGRTHLVSPAVAAATAVAGTSPPADLPH